MPDLIAVYKDNIPDLTKDKRIFGVKPFTAYIPTQGKNFNNHLIELIGLSKRITLVKYLIGFKHYALAKHPY